MATWNMPDSKDPIREILSELDSRDYIADPAIATSIHMARALERPLLIGGARGWARPR